MREIKFLYQRESGELASIVIMTAQAESDQAIVSEAFKVSRELPELERGSLWRA